MPLPVDPKATWPPKELEPFQHDVDEASAWYSGDTARLENFYGGTSPQAGGRSWVRFWSRRAADAPASNRQRLHVPAAGDIASTSADLLFGDEPTITVPDNEATQERLEAIMAEDGIGSRLLEGAEICAALGGVYLRPVWDRAVAPRPMLTVVHPDNAVPEFAWGVLTAVTFWRVVGGSHGSVLRHLERHEPGRITHGLYDGTKDALGIRRPLAESPSTADLDVNEDGELLMPPSITGLVCRYVPNVLPNRKHRGKPIGRSDFQGTEGLMDSLDETFTSWMRDIRLGKRRIVVPDEFLERKGRGKGAQFDVDQEVFTPLEIDPAHQDKAGITPIDFAIRTQDHAATMLSIFENIIRTAGYSASSFGIADGDRDVTATEVRSKERKSMRTRARKARYWLPAVEDTLELMLVIDREIFGSKVEVARPQVELAEQGDDPKVRAETLDLFTRAQAMSLETRVRMAQPHLQDDQVAEEVARIQQETGLSVVDPTGGFPESP